MRLSTLDVDDSLCGPRADSTNLNDVIDKNMKLEIHHLHQSHFPSLLTLHKNVNVFQETYCSVRL